MPNTSGVHSEWNQRSSRKRKVSSPIKPGQDYSVVLRKQEISASPALKKHKDLEEHSEEDTDDEVILVKKPKMNATDGNKQGPQLGMTHLAMRFRLSHLRTSHPTWTER